MISIMNEKSKILPSTLRMVAWEVTRSCNLDCVHCRASSRNGAYPGELSTEAGFRFLDEVASFSQPVIILTGGEPLMREDIFDLAAYGTAKGLRMVMATNGTLVDEGTVKKMLAAGIRRVSISIDGPDRESHDAFRRVPGAFDGAMAGIEAMKRGGMEFQINTTITQMNLPQLAEIHDLTLRIGAAAHHIFLLVPTGRGKEMADQSISPGDYEETLQWFYRESLDCPIQLKATCAPHYFRVLHQQKDQAWKKAAGPLHAMTRGCMGGSSFCFISHTGQAQPCGYLELDCGQLKEKSFYDIWHHSKIFQELRDLNLYEGKCGSCEFLKVCGGCRARAYEVSGNHLAEEPYCVYEPGGGLSQIYGRSEAKS
ncbi:MAG: heme b synthase [Smithellaceae bacterium]|nr:heme b synthase [Smithellaceae bacterium]